MLRSNVSNLYPIKVNKLETEVQMMDPVLKIKLVVGHIYLLERLPTYEPMSGIIRTHPMLIPI